MASIKGSGHRIKRAAGLRPDLGRLNEPEQAAKFALRTLARRVKAINEEITEIDAHMAELVRVVSDSAELSRGGHPARRPAAHHRRPEPREAAQ
jgi:hypothetical protein